MTLNDFATIQYNTAGIYGGGIYNWSFGGTGYAKVTVNNYATIQDSTAGTNGGGIYNLPGR